MNLPKEYHDLGKNGHKSMRSASFLKQLSTSKRTNLHQDSSSGNKEGMNLKNKVEEAFAKCLRGKNL